MRQTTQVVEFEGDGVKARLTVAAATVRMGIERTIMQNGARRFEDEPGVALLRRFTWPDLVASTVEGEIEIENGGAVKVRPVFDLTFEEWLELPEALVISWETAVYELNPHWLPGQEGKARSGSGRSETSSGSACSDGTNNEPLPEKIR